MVPELPHSDQHHLQAAQGWLELGNPGEANEELDKITPSSRTHPNVLEVQWEIYAQAKKWEACVDIAQAIIDSDPGRVHAWIHRSFALHVLKRTQEAYARLLPLGDKCSDIWTVPYNLACYCAQMGRLDECRTWFKRAMAIDEQSVQRAGTDDPDLKPLWDSMGGSMSQAMN